MRIGIAAAALAATLGALGAAGTANAAKPVVNTTTLTGAATADDSFYAYVSNSPTVRGTSVGSGNAWSTGYPVTSTDLGPGTWYLHIEATNGGGPGGFSGVFDLSGDGVFANGAQELTTDPGSLNFWSGSYNGANSTGAELAWKPATGSVAQDTSYNWGSPAGTSNWIWPTDAASRGPCQFCTVDISAKFSVPGGVPEPATWAMLMLGVFGAGAALRSRRRAEAAAVTA